MAEQFSGTLLPQNQNVEETQKTALDLLSKINKVSQSAEDALNAVKKTIPSTYTPPAWQPYPAGTYSFPSGNQAVAAGVLPIGASATAPTFGNGAIKKAKFRNWGSSLDLFIDIQNVSTTGGNNGSGTYYIPLPLGYQLDTSQIALTTTGVDGSCIAVGSFFSITAARNGTIVLKAISSTLLVGVIFCGPNGGTIVTALWSTATGLPASEVFNLGGIVTGIPIQ
jgi:hypothetical protein